MIDKTKILHFIDSPAFVSLLFAFAVILFSALVLTLISIVIRGAAQFRLSEKTGLAIRAENFVPFMRNTCLCKLGEKAYTLKHNKASTEYASYCKLLQWGNIVADLGVIVLSIASFFLLASKKENLQGAFTFAFIMLIVCLIARLVSGIANRIIMAKALNRILENVGKRVPIALGILAPVTDFALFGISKSYPTYETKQNIKDKE